MSQTERRLGLLHVLCLRWHDIYDNLAHEFNVCKRTIRYDVAVLIRLSTQLVGDDLATISSIIFQLIAIGKPTVSDVSGFSPLRTVHDGFPVTRRSINSNSHTLSQVITTNVLVAMPILPKPIKQKWADFPLLCGVC